MKSRPRGANVLLGVFVTSLADSDKEEHLLQSFITGEKSGPRFHYQTRSSSFSRVFSWPRERRRRLYDWDFRVALK